jgi:hypothetical protein
MALRVTDLLRTSKSLTIEGPLLWSSGQSSWLQIQRSGFDSWRYHTDHVTPSIHKFGTTLTTGGGRSVGIVRSRTQAAEFSFSFSTSEDGKSGN